MTPRQRRWTAGLVAAAFVLTACGGSDDDDTGDTQSTTTTTPSSTTTAPPAGEEVEADAFEVPFTIEKPAGWSNPTLESENISFVLAPPQTSALYTTALAFSIPAAATMDAVTQEISASTDYTVGEPTEVTVAGKSAVRFDVEIDPANPGPPPLFNLAETGLFWGLFAGNQGRIYVIDVDGNLVTATIEAPIESFEDFATEAETVLATVVF